MRKERLILERVPVTSVASEGKCIARVDNRVIFIRNTAPGDIIDVKIVKKKKNYFEGYPTQFHQYSDLRVEPVCSHFGTCGGCKWQHLTYSAQLKFKQQQVVDALERIGKVDTSGISEIIPSEQTEFYRNKLEYAFASKRWLTHEEIASRQDVHRKGVGFHVPGRFDRVVDLEKCYLQPEPSNQVRDLVKHYADKNDLDFYDHANYQGFLRNLIIRTSTLGEVMVIVQFGNADNDKIQGLMEHINSNVDGITSLQYVVNEKKNETFHDLKVITHSGRDHIMEKIGDLQFKIGPKSFFQTNTTQAAKLYAVAKDFADLSGAEVIYDLYCGTGTITNYLAADAKIAIGIDSIPEAIGDARWNSDFNKISNTEFLAGDIKDVLTDDILNQHGRPDLIITDPPRAGMHPDVVKRLLAINAQRIIYISCNPATQARDLELLSGKYQVERIQPIDMFPHTHHVENVVLLNSISK